MSQQNISQIMGRQEEFSSAYSWVHVLFAGAFSIASVVGVWNHISDMSLVGMICGIIISDLTIYKLANAWKNNELVGEQKSWSYVLYAFAMGDVFFGAMSKGVDSVAVGYYAWGMWLALVCIMICYTVIFVIVNPAAQASNDEKVAELRLHQAEHKAVIADKRNRADAKLLKAKEATAERRTRWATRSAFFGALMSKPAGIINRGRIKRKASRAFGGFLQELDMLQLASPQQQDKESRVDRREIVIEPSGDGAASFR